MGRVSSVRRSEDSPCCFRAVRGAGVRVIWELISKCNLDCAHCFVDHVDYGIGTEQALAVIAEFPSLPVAKVMFTGGEPFLRKDLLQLVEACLAQGVLVDITTNLSLVDDTKVAALAALGLPEITTSLDGPEAVHDTIRGKAGQFREVVDRVGKLRAAGIAVDLVCVAQRANAEHLGETIDIARAIGASSITISGFNRQNAARERAARVELLPGQLAVAEAQITAARARHGAGFPIRTVGLLQCFTEPVPCPIEGIVGINARGEINHCLLAPTPPELRGDVRTGLHAAWASLNRDHCCSEAGWQPLRWAQTEGAC